MKVAIFGGTFNPIHIGHLIMAQYVLNYTDIDKIIFVPNGVPPHKSDMEIASGKDRFEMVRLSIEDNPNLDISDFEIKKKTPSWTIDTLQFFSQKYDQVYFMLGSDNLFDILKWKRSTEILRSFPLIVLPRQRNTRGVYKLINHYTDKYCANITFVNMPLIDVSSTEIRKLIKENKSIRYMVCSKVEEYIKRKGLYLDKHRSNPA